MKRILGSYIGLMGLAAVLFLGLNCQRESRPLDSDGFLNSTTSAASIAAETGKDVFVHVGADWCKPCRVLHREIYPKANVQEALGGYIKLELDMDKLAEEDVEIIRLLNVQSIPMIAVLKSDLRTVVRKPTVAKASEQWVLNYLAVNQPSQSK